MNIRTPKNKARLINVYKLLLFLFGVIVALVPGSVTSEPEIETKLLITVVGVDRTEEGIGVSATAVMPQEEGGGSTKRLNVHACAPSLSEAIEKLSLKIGKKPEMGLCGLIVLGSSFTSGSVLPELDYMISGGRFISGAYLVLSPERSAKDTIEMSNMLGEATGNGLSRLIEYNADATAMPAVTLLRFLSDTGSVSRSSFVPCITIGEKQSLGKSSGGTGSEQGQGGESGGGSGDKETEIKSLDSIALFRGGEFVRLATRDETRGFTWTDDKSKKGLVCLDDFSVDGHGAGGIYCRLISKKVGIKARLCGGTPTVTIKVKAKLQFEDRHKLAELYRYDGVDEKRIEESVKEQFADKIRRELSLAVAAMRETNCDVMGVAADLWRSSPDEYRAFPAKENLLSGAEVNYDISVSFR